MKSLEEQRKKGRTKTAQSIKIKKKRKSKYWYINENTGKRTYVRYIKDLPKEEQKKRRKHRKVKTSVDKEPKEKRVKTEKPKVKKPSVKKPKTTASKKSKVKKLKAHRTRKPWSEQRKKEHADRMRNWWKEHPEERERARKRLKDYWEKKRQKKEPIPELPAPIITSNIEIVRNDIMSLPVLIYSSGIKHDMSYLIDDLLNTIEQMILQYGEQEYDNMLLDRVSDIDKLVYEILVDQSSVENYRSKAVIIKSKLMCKDLKDMDINENIENTMRDKQNEDSYDWMNNIGDFNLLE